LLNRLQTVGKQGFAKLYRSARYVNQIILSPTSEKNILGIVFVCIGGLGMPRTTRTLAGKADSLSELLDARGSTVLARSSG